MIRRRAIAATLARDNVGANLAGLGFDIVAQRPDTFADLVARSVGEFGAVIRAAAIRSEGA